MKAEHKKAIIQNEINSIEASQYLLGVRARIAGVIKDEVVKNNIIKDMERNEQILDLLKKEFATTEDD